jgi:hypothetical protein
MKRKYPVTLTRTERESLKSLIAAGSPSSEVTVVVVEAAPKHPILPDSSRVPNRLYLHSQRGLPVGI